MLLTDDWSEVSEHVISNKDDTGTVLIAKNSSSTETVSSVGKSLNAMILDYGSRDYYNCYNRYDNGELPIGEFVPFHGWVDYIYIYIYIILSITFFKILNIIPIFICCI